MQRDDFLCSELIRLSSGRSAVVGNLELISPAGCTVIADAPLPAGTPVRMHCVSCPLGKKSCSECRFKGKVVDRQIDPTLGCILRIEFEHRIWTGQWRPRRLTALQLLHQAALDGAPRRTAKAFRQPAKLKNLHGTQQARPDSLRT